MVSIWPSVVLPLYPTFGACGLCALTWSWLLLVCYYAQFIECSCYLSLHCPQPHGMLVLFIPILSCCVSHAVKISFTVVVVIVVDFIMIITITRSCICAIVHVHVCVCVCVCVCAVYRLYEMSWFVESVLQDCPWWSLLLPSMVTPCIHRDPVFPLDSYCRSCGKNVESLWVSLFLIYVSCLDFQAS